MVFDFFAKIDIMITNQKEWFLKHLGQTSPFPPCFEIERAEGIFLYDSAGNQYIDAISGICVSNLGHGQKEIIKAIQEQAAKYIHPMVYGEFVLSPQVKYAKLLADHLPSHLSCTYFMSSGSEALEGAMKMAKRYTGRHEMIACAGAYHGSTHGALSLMSSNKYKIGYYPFLPGIQFIEFNNLKTLEKITAQTAGVVLEPIQAGPGLRLPNKTFLKALRQRCTDTGALLIFDEIQVGFGRSGSMFAFEQLGVEPDVLLLAKALGGGLPLGAFISSREIMSVVSHHPMLGHITTFGGSPVCCAAGLAFMNVLIEHPEIIDSVPEKSALITTHLKHPLVKKIRNAGLLIAVDFEDEKIAAKVLETCFKHRFITTYFLFNEACIRIAPPLNISFEEISILTNQLIFILDECLKN